MDQNSSGGGRPLWQPDPTNRRKGQRRSILVLILIVVMITVLCMLMGLLFACIVLYSYPGSIFKATGSNAPNLAESYAVYLSADSHSLLKLDPQTDEILKTVRMSNGPGDMAASPDGKRLYICTGRKVTILNSADASFIRDLSFDMEVVMVELSPDGTRLYVNYCNHDSPGNVAIIDTASYQVIDTVYDVPFSWGMATSPDGQYLYMSDYWNKRLTVIDTTKGSIAKSISCGSGGGCAGDVAISPDGRLVYVTIWSGNYMAIIDARTMSLKDTVNMGGSSSSGVALSPDGQYLYLSCCDANRLLIINADTNVIEDQIPVERPRHVRITPDGNYLYIFSEDAPVAKFDTRSRMVETLPDITGSNVAFPAGQ